jgi:hypothetical protein
LKSFLIVPLRCRGFDSDDGASDESGSSGTASVWLTNTEEREGGDVGEADPDDDVGGSDARWLDAGDWGPGAFWRDCGRVKGAEDSGADGVAPR